MKNGKHMIVLSLDAVGGRDLPYLKTLPNFRELYGRSSVCGHVTSVYPSLTYPAHTSIVTGRYPKNHGIVNNLQNQPERDPSDWFWQRKYVRGTTLYDEAERAGLKTAALLWPVTGKAGIHYNLPEILPNRPWQNQAMVSMANGTPRYELELQLKYGAMRKGILQPWLDDFACACLEYTLRKYRPGLTLVHLTDVDTNRHLHGVESREAIEALRRHDERLGRVVRLLKELRMYEETDLVVLGDHYQKDVCCAVYPNYELMRRGWLAARNGKVTDWRAIARDCDGSCYIYLKEGSLTEEAGRVLREIQGGTESGIARIFTAKEAADLGADPRCSFMLEAADGYYFQNGCDRYMRSSREAGPASDQHASFRIQAATHGYLPDQRGYETIFVAAGPDFCTGVSVPAMSLVDEGPTLAKALGVSLGKVDGKIVDSFLKV